jgi:lysophospholipase L1-like esterase
LKSFTFTLAASLAVASGCGSRGTAPTPTPKAPSISCPAGVDAVSHQAQPQTTVSFDVPQAQDGQAPVTVICTPPSGAAYPNGTTTVTCEATDALLRKAQCTFPIVITPVPLLQKTNFLAFGDSFTEGKATLTFNRSIFDAPGSYPRRLKSKLDARYTDQSITVTPDGLGGEEAGAGKLRLREDLPRFNPEVLLLLEGANDLLKPSTGTPQGLQGAMDSVVDALRDMIRQGKARGARVYVATLLPIDAAKWGNAANGVEPLNARIKSLAAAENVVLVDLYAAVPLSMIGSDGLHPKADTYEVIADTWLASIVATLQVAVSP